MYKVIKNEQISSNSFLMEVIAPIILKRFIPGQFVIVMAKEDSERIPLTIYDYDHKKGTISLIYQIVGASTEELSTIKNEIFAIVGPLGNPNEICKNPKNYKDKKIVYVAGGVGIAPIYPQVKYLKERGYNIDVIYGARNANLLIIRMKNVCDLTKKYKLRTIVSMNPLMVDGSGMCGACRCEVEGKPKFACIHGPEFDGHKVNFELALKRMNIYKEEEQEKWAQMKKKNS